MKRGRADTLTHDDKRHGTTTLFAALDVIEGKVIGRCGQPVVLAVLEPRSAAETSCMRDGPAGRRGVPTFRRLTFLCPR
jgi:hypothetical protein